MVERYNDTVEAGGPIPPGRTNNSGFGGALPTRGAVKGPITRFIKNLLKNGCLDAFFLVTV